MMETEFIRAKSKENKTIRLQQIMDTADHLFHDLSYHEITLSLIAKEIGLARGGLYKYVTSKEEIFLLIYLQKERTITEELISKLNETTVSVSSLSEIMAEILHRNIDFIRYHQILNAIIETNVSVELLAQFKKESNELHQPLFHILKEHFHMNQDESFDFYLTVLYHCVYLHDRANYQSNYVEAMNLAGLKIVDIDFEESLRKFIKQLLKRNSKPI